MVALPPVAEREGDIRRSIEQNAVTIVTAEPGAWKSTLIPQYAIDYGRLVFTQPRTLAAISITERIASLREENVGDTFAWRVSKKGSANWQRAKGLVCTDGYIAVRELFGSGTNFGRNKRFDVLALDELHEWNRFQEVLVALARKTLAEKPDAFKFVTMSATLEAKRLQEWFQLAGITADVIHIEGRSFDVAEIPRGASICDDAENYLRLGKNVLIFQPTVKTIEETIAELTKRGIDAVILPLHGKLTSAEQKRCFEDFDRPKCIVATNVAQTSITIPGIQVVIDSGLELRREEVNGIIGYHIRAISMKDREQRKGRAGRTELGLFIDHCPFEDRLQWPKPEFAREPLDQVFLQLLECGVDPASLEFFHQPEPEDFAEALRRPTVLGCLDADGQITEVGKKVSRLPMSVPVGRMFVEAEKRGVTQDILLFEALRECDGVTQRGSEDWRHLIDVKHPSDITAQVAVYHSAVGMASGAEREASGINLRDYRQVRKAFAQLKKDLKGKVKLSSTGNAMDVVAAVCTGMIENLWRHTGGGWYERPGQQSRQIDRNSVVKGAEWIIAFPADITFGEVHDRKTRHLLRWATEVQDPRWVAVFARGLIRDQDFDLVYDAATDSVSGVRKSLIGPHVLSETPFVEQGYADAARPFADWLVGDWRDQVEPDSALWKVLESNTAIRRSAMPVRLDSGILYPYEDREPYLEWLFERLAGARRLSEIEDVEALRLPPLDLPQTGNAFTRWVSGLFRWKKNS